MEHYIGKAELITSGGSGSVTSVGIIGNTGIIVANSPITSSGDILLSIDQPNLPLNLFGGTLSVSKGGTGLITIPNNGILVGGGTNPISVIAAPSSPNTYLSWNGASFQWTNVASGSFVQKAGDTMTGSLTQNGGQFLGDSAATVMAPAFSFSSSTGTGLYYSGASTIGFASASTTPMTVSSSAITANTEIAFVSSSGGVIDITGANEILTIVGTGALNIPVGNTAQQPNPPVDGMIRLNTDTQRYEAQVNSLWFPFTGEPLVPDQIVVNDTYVIPSGYHMIAAEDFTVLGTLILNGRLILI